MVHVARDDGFLLDKHGHRDNAVYGLNRQPLFHKRPANLPWFRHHRAVGGEHRLICIYVRILVGYEYNNTTRIVADSMPKELSIGGGFGQV